MPVQLNTRSKSTPFCNVLNEERKFIKEKILGNAESDHRGFKGLALSGGGIRSAYIAKGFLRSFYRKYQRPFEYMSTVSGGGYTGAELSRDFVFNAEDKCGFVQRVKRNGFCELMKLALSFILTMLLLYIPAVGFLFFFFALGHIEHDTSAPLLLRWFGAVVFISFLCRAFNKRYGPKKMLKLSEPLFLVLSMNFGLLVVSWGAQEAFIWCPYTLYIFPILALGLLYIVEKTAPVFEYRKKLFRWLYSFSLVFFLSMTIGAFLTYFMSQRLNGNNWALFLLYGIILFQLLIFFPNLIERLDFFFRFYRDNLRDQYLNRGRKSGEELALLDLKSSNGPFHIFNAASCFGPDREHFFFTHTYSGSFRDGFFRTDEWFRRMSIAELIAISGSAINIREWKVPFSAVLQMFIPHLGRWIRRRPGKDGGEKTNALAYEHTLSYFGVDPIDHLRLIDGGFVDNLGVLTLLHRRVKLIICLDASDDPNYTFEDLMRLMKQANVKGIATISIPTLALDMALFRSYQNTKDFMVGRIHYPKTDFADEDVGVYIHVKANPRTAPKPLEYENFPQFSTVDQLLSSDILDSLVKLGGDMASDLQEWFSTAELSELEGYGSVEFQ